MSINFDKGIYNCFSCGKGGSIESLYWDLTGKSLRREMGLGKKDEFSSFARGSLYSELPDNSLDLKDIRVDIVWEDMESAWGNRASREYLEGRGIPKSVCSSLSMQFAERTWINNTLFQNRIIIPIYENNRLIAVEGRRLSKESSEPKVLYCKGGSVNTLFDIDHLNREETLYAVEGLMDLAVLRANEAFKNSTCIFGANVTKRQIHLLSQFKKVVYIPDQDTAGENTVLKLKESSLDNIYILRLPKKLNNIDIKDVGDLGSHGIPLDYLLSRKWFSYEKKL
jgi:DNA primase